LKNKSGLLKNQAEKPSWKVGFFLQHRSHLKISPNLPAYRRQASKKGEDCSIPDGRFAF
jgi:predicted hotdog family 3-hydroxylacyl-ACP dehydratase